MAGRAGGNVFCLVLVFCSVLFLFWWGEEFLK